MIAESIKVIDGLDSGAATTIVVDAGHLQAMFFGLQKEFPDHAIVALFPKKLSKADRRNYIPGLQELMVKPQKMDAIKEL